MERAGRLRESGRQTQDAVVVGGLLPAAGDTFSPRTGAAAVRRSGSGGPEAAPITRPPRRLRPMSAALPPALPPAAAGPCLSENVPKIQHRRMHDEL